MLENCKGKQKVDGLKKFSNRKRIGGKIPKKLDKILFLKLYGGYLGVKFYCCFKPNRFIIYIPHYAWGKKDKKIINL